MSNTTFDQNEPNLEAVEKLLHAGADPQIALEHGSQEVKDLAQSFISNQVDYGEDDEYINDEKTYLDAARNGDLRTVKMLHDDVSPYIPEMHINGDGQWEQEYPEYENAQEIHDKALFFAAHNGHLDVVQYLVNEGIEPEIALEHGSEEVREWAEQYIENHPIVRDYISDLAYELSDVLDRKGIRQVEYDLEYKVLEQFGEWVQGDQYTPESYDLLNNHITDEIKFQIDSQFDYIKNQAIGDGFWDDYLLEQDDEYEEEEEEEELSTFATVTKLVSDTTGDIKYDPSTKDDLLKQVLDKQSTKAQKLSDDIESEGFTYRPPVNKNAGKKL